MKYPNLDLTRVVCSFLVRSFSEASVSVFQEILMLFTGHLPRKLLVYSLIFIDVFSVNP